MSVFNITVIIIIINTPPWVFSPYFLSKERTDVWWVSKKTLCSAFIFDFPDWWNQTTSGFVLVDLVGHVSAHGLDLNVPGVGIFWFICKPFLFWRGQGERGREEDRVSLKCYTIGGLHTTILPQFKYSICKAFSMISIRQCGPRWRFGAVRQSDRHGIICVVSKWTKSLVFCSSGGQG